MNRLNRRDCLQTGLAGLAGWLISPWSSGAAQLDWERAARPLVEATSTGLITSAVLHVRTPRETITRAFGEAGSAQAMFLLGSISKPICLIPLLKLLEEKQLQLDDPLRKYLPEFLGGGREAVLVQHLLTHVSGVPDQVARNHQLRRRHARLAEYVAQAVRTPLEFAPGSRYQYSSMGILLACHIAEVLTGKTTAELVTQQVFEPLKLTRSAVGLGKFALTDFVPVQTEQAAPEAGAGDPEARDWDWNSPYWRGLGAPWGGVQASAADVGTILAELMSPANNMLRPETARLMIRNHNPPPLTPRGLGFGVGTAAGVPGCSAATFGHTGSTGTFCWADPQRQAVCVVLTSLPGRAVTPHPRELAAREVSALLG